MSTTTHALPGNKTKIICTIGPASDTPEMLRAMLDAGMNIARLNFSHGSFEAHGHTIQRIREASAATGKPVAIMADLPGPKIRLGNLESEPIELARGDEITLTTDETVIGNASIVAVTLKELPRAVRPGNVLFINDGLIEIEVERIEGEQVHCRVLTGGTLRSRKGLNLPGIDLGISAFTEHDRECMRFALENGVDAVSQSFVDDAADILAVREAAREMGFDPFIIAKVERSSILDKLDSILPVADGVMIARGDLGVEIPIERIALVQKKITLHANRCGKPVITATQMLESMVNNRRPTRAEATDVANAILDGTDCVMLSEESAMGSYPLDALRMLVRIASAVEPHRKRQIDRRISGHQTGEVDYIASSVSNIVLNNKGDEIAAILAPTHSGQTARRLSRYKLPVWILAATPSQRTCRELLFSYGVYPIHEYEHPLDWGPLARQYAVRYELTGRSMLQTEGPSPSTPMRPHKIEIIDLAPLTSRSAAV